jgi:hypothetical protein
VSSDGATEQAPDEAGEEDKPSRIAGAVVLLVLAGVAVLVLKVIVTAAPYTAYLVAGILSDRAWLKARSWIARRRGTSDGDELEDEAASETLPETLHRLAAPHVFLADIADARGLSKEAMRAVLEALGIRVRRAVRNGDDTGVGVHRDDIPPLPRPSRETPETPVDQGQPTNQQGITVEDIGLAGVVVKDGSEIGRRHRIQ